MKQRKIDIPRESDRVEWKESLGEWKEIVETCAAFATARGGTIYVGVAPHGTTNGIEIGKGTLEDLSNKIRLNTDPPQFPAIEITELETKNLLTIHVEESPIKPVWAFGRPVKRVARTNQFLRRDEAFRLMTATTGRTWDALPCEGFMEKDIDRKAVRDYLRRTGMKLSTPLNDLLKNLGMPQNNSRFCNADVLLFARRPQSFLIETEVKCGRFEGTEPVNFLDERTIEGNVLHQLDESIAFVRRNTRQAIHITGKPERETVPEYPDEAVREAITNALCHRDYASVGTVQVRIFNDRLEVWNPGLLMTDLTIEALYRQHASHPRNPRLAHALYRARVIEHWGTGTLRIIHACEGSNIKVEFLIQAGSFVIRLQKKAPILTEGVGKKVGERVGKKVGEGLSTKQQDILSLIQLDPKISAKRIASKIGISTRKTEDHLRKLRIGGFLVRVGSPRGGYWEVLIR
jgi:ATP-dependent DNA helicase RecG